MESNFTDRPVVYVETSVVSYYTARPSRDVGVLSHQDITREWWGRAQERFRLVISELVVLEAKAGDEQAVKKRLDAVADFPVLPGTLQADEIGKIYLRDLPLPHKASRDAAHLAIASVHGVDYLVTWNCDHVANALIRRKLAEINERLNLAIPVICTPEEMIGE